MALPHCPSTVVRHLEQVGEPSPDVVVDGAAAAHGLRGVRGALRLAGHGGPQPRVGRADHGGDLPRASTIHPGSHTCSMDAIGWAGARCRAMRTLRTWLALRRDGRRLSLLAVARGWS
jgi:hypothetical protein